MAEGYNNDEIFGVQSDDFHEYPCSPCSKGDRNVAAVKYCVECDENICGKCVIDHNRFSVMKCHQISDKMKTDVKLVGPGLPSQRCNKHDGKIIDVYCTEHDCVGCSTCIAIDHRACNEVKYIPDVAHTVNLSKSIPDLAAEIEILEKRICALKKRKANAIKQSLQDKYKILKDIRQLREELIEQLDKLVNYVSQEVDTVINEKEAFIDAQVTEMNCVMAKLTETKHKLSEIKDRTLSEQFVELKTRKQDLSITSKTLKRFEDEDASQQSHVEFHLDRDVENFLQEGSSLGYIANVPVINSIYDCREVNVKLDDDNLTCAIKNMCLLSSGELVLTDGSNKKIKVLDDSYNVTEYISTPDQPVGICVINSSRFAVSLLCKQTIHFLSRDPLTYENAFQVRGRCRGIAFYDGQLYVCCAGLKSEGEGPGHIEVYNLSGTLLRTFYEHIVCPWYVNIANRGSQLLVSDMRANRITEIDLTRKKHTAAELKVIFAVRPSGICSVADSRQLVISGCDSNNILLLSKGQQPRALLSQNGGIIKPRAVVFDKNCSRLIVSFEAGDKVKVYTFKE